MKRSEPAAGGGVLHSDHAPVEVGGATLDAMVRAAAERFPHRPALIDGAGGGVTYAELVERAGRVATLPAERGLAPGDVLALWAPNVPAWADVALGALRAGVTVTGVSPAASEAELAAQLADSGAALVVTLPALRAAAERAGARAVVTIGDELLAATGPAPTAPAEVALLPYSSGTTRLPKGVVITHRNLSTAVRQFQAGLRLTERDTIVAVARSPTSWASCRTSRSRWRRGRRWSRWRASTRSAISISPPSTARPC